MPPTDPVVENVVALLLGFLLDQVLGDPPGWPHPVRWVGRLVGFVETPLRRVLPERLGGIVLLVVASGLAGATTWGALELAGLWHAWARVGLASVLVYWGLAARSLAREAAAVREACARANWPAARRQLARIVGRDTHDLSPEEICRACIETVAENTTDGVVAPLFYAALAGPVGLWVYKAINTLDSMVGYRNERYLRFGWASARADDVANFVPARLTFLLMALSAILVGADGRQALAVGWRDRRKHPSPNSGWAEAVMAGALRVQLGGPCSYHGVPSFKPLLGELSESLKPDKIGRAIRLMLVTAWLALGVSCCIAVLVGKIYQLSEAAVSPAVPVPSLAVYAVGCYNGQTIVP